jgi:hypothetical protein
MTQPAPNDFEKAAASEPVGLVAEFWDFACKTKKWWLLPILLIFVLIGAMLLLSGSAAAPFIYTLF